MVGDAEGQRNESCYRIWTLHKDRAAEVKGRLRPPLVFLAMQFFSH
jgi:hypothetical protein